MPRTRMTNVSAAQWSPNGGAMGHSDLTQDGAYAFGENVFSPAVQRQRLSPPSYKRLQETLDSGQPLEPPHLPRIILTTSAARSFGIGSVRL